VKKQTNKHTTNQTTNQPNNQTNKEKTNFVITACTPELITNIGLTSQSAEKYRYRQKFLKL